MIAPNARPKTSSSTLEASFAPIHDATSMVGQDRAARRRGRAALLPEARDRGERLREHADAAGGVRDRRRQAEHHEQRHDQERAAARERVDQPARDPAADQDRDLAQRRQRQSSFSCRASRAGVTPKCWYARSGRDAPARRAVEEALLDQERLVDVLDRVAVLADRRGQRVDVRPGRRRTSRSARAGAARSMRSKPALVDLEPAEREARELARDRAPRRRPRAKSRTRRSRRFAMRGVPRERCAISLRAVRVDRDAEDARAARAGSARRSVGG